jgi:hypothetical protein
VTPDSLLALDSTALADTTGVLRPRTAMLRSWAFPGWGQASAGAYVRGGFFVAAQGGSWYMLMKTIGKLSEARSIEKARMTWVSDSLRTVIFTDPDGAGEALMDPTTFQEAVEADTSVVAATALVESRRQQRQDWITATIFLTLVSGVDAYVSAHLADAPISLETAAAPDGSVRLGVRVPIGRRP